MPGMRGRGAEGDRPGIGDTEVGIAWSPYVVVGWAGAVVIGTRHIHFLSPPAPSSLARRGLFLSPWLAPDQGA